MKDYTVQKFFISFIASISIIFSAASSRAETYVSWENLEPDKIASIWLIKRYVNPEASFQFIAKGATPDKSRIPFDIPSAELRRFQTRSTYETILAHFQITDHHARYIGTLIHDIEINTWKEKKFPETIAFERGLWDIIDRFDTNEQRIDAAFSYLDDFKQKKRK